MEDYSFSYYNTSRYKGDANIRVKLHHFFRENCYVLKDLAPNFYGASICFTGVFAIWVLFTFHIRKEYAYPVQKIITLIPALKAMETFLYATYYMQCPWADADIATMGKVTSVTFTYTFIHALFFMLAKGWSTTTQNVDRNEATNLTIVMGLVYLIYSAYFLSSDFEGMM